MVYSEINFILKDKYDLDSLAISKFRALAWQRNKETEFVIPRSATEINKIR